MPMISASSSLVRFDGVCGPVRWGRRSAAVPLEDRVAAVVVGGARLEAEGGGEFPFGEAAEFPEGDHADLLLDALCLGEGDGLADTVCEHESAVFDLNVEVESEMHGHGLPRGGVGVPERGRYVHVIYAPSQKPSTMEQGQTGSVG